MREDNQCKGKPCREEQEGIVSSVGLKHGDPEKALSRGFRAKALMEIWWQVQTQTQSTF
jgi:hypothetical protein